MCEYCNGSEETQQPLEDNGIGVFTIIAKKTAFMRFCKHKTNGSIGKNKLLPNVR